MITKDPRGVGSAPPLHCTLGRMRVWRHASRTVRLLRGDIAHSDTDAIAVSSNPFLMGTLRSNFARFSGRTNADGAVRALGGASLLAATSRLRGSSGRLPLSPGSAVVSEAGSELRARWVVHCVAPDSSSRGPSCWHGSEQGDHALEQLRDDIVSQRALAPRHGEPELFLALHTASRNASEVTSAIVRRLAWRRKAWKQRLLQPTARCRRRFRPHLRRRAALERLASPCQQSAAASRASMPRRRARRPSAWRRLGCAWATAAAASRAALTTSRPCAASTLSSGRTTCGTAGLPTPCHNWAQWRERRREPVECAAPVWAYRLKYRAAGWA